MKGLEVDGVFAGIRNTSVRFAGAYTDARYQYFPNSAQPLENGFTGAAPYQDVSGQLLPGAAKFSFNISPEVRFPFAADKTIHAGFNTAFISRYKSDNSLSSYSWIPAHSVTDFAAGTPRPSRDGLACSSQEDCSPYGSSRRNPAIAEIRGEFINEPRALR